MAVNTRAKRAAALSVCPLSLTLPPSDGAINQSDKQSVAFSYGGVASVADVVTNIPLTLTIEGTSVRFLVASYRISEPSNAEATLTVSILSTLGTYRPSLDQEVIVTKGASTLFGGYVATARESGPFSSELGTMIITTLDVPSYAALASQRGDVSETIASGSLKDALTILINYLTPYGIVIDPAQVDGPLLPLLTYDYVTLKFALDDIATRSGYIWQIDATKQLRMFLPGFYAAPFNAVDGTGYVIGDLTVVKSRQSQSTYANRVIVRGGTPDVPITAIANDLDEQSINKLWAVTISAPTVFDAASAQALANAYLLQHTPAPKTVKYTTYTPGVHAGQTQIIQAARRNINNVFLIVDVQADLLENHMRWVVTAIEGSVYQGSWRDTYSQWSNGLATIVAIPGGGSGTRAAYYLGGSSIEYVQSATLGTWVAVDGTLADPGVQVKIDTVARGTTAATVTARLRAAAGSVQARLRNVSDGITVGTSSVVNTPTFQTVQFDVILTPGSKIYQLELLPSQINTNVAGIGYVE